MPEVQLKNLCKSFSEDVTAVNNLSLTINQGELLVLVGPSGCGKSTSLRLIAGLETATSGQIFIDNQDITELPPGQRKIGMVFQHYALYPHKTIFGNLAFGLKLRKTPKAEINRLIEDIASRLGISDLLKRYPDQISGGQKQRVALGRALLRQTDLILFDEPLSNLDASLRQQMRIEISSLHKERGFTGIFVTHDQTEAMTLGDRIAVMDKGELKQIGTPQEIYSQPADTFVASFTGTPGMNLIPGACQRNHFKTALFEIDLPEEKYSATTSIGIRPEDIKVAEGPISFSAKVIQPELCGQDWLIHLAYEGGNLSCRSAVSLNSSDTVLLSTSIDKIHFFDHSGKRLN